MKNLFIALAVLLSAGAMAQTKTVKKPVTQNVSTPISTPNDLAKNDFALLKTVVKVEDQSKASELFKFFESKHMTQKDVNLSSERKVALLENYENILLNILGEKDFNKLKANKQVFNKLMK